MEQSDQPQDFYEYVREEKNSMLAHFASCSTMEQWRLLAQRGDFVLDIWYYRHKVSLYIFCGCYVEVFYAPKGGAIEKIAPLDEKHWAFYADQVKLPALCDDGERSAGSLRGVSGLGE